MDTGRMSQGQMLAAISGAVLVISLFLKWIGVDTPSGLENLPGVSDVASSADQTGFESQSSLDIYLLIVAVFAILPAVLSMGVGGAEFPFVSAASGFLLGVIGIVLVFFTMFVGFPDGASRKFGLWLALIAVIGVTIGQYLAMQEEVAEYDTGRP